MEENKHEKFEEREIKFGARDPWRQEKEHGKLYRWFDNFWYHHKWAVIAALVVVLVLTVCIAQMCNREEQGDLVIVAAGPYGFVTNEAGQRALVSCLATYLDKDYNGNGQKEVTLYNYTVYSEEEINEMANRLDEYGMPNGVNVDRYQSTQEYQSFKQYLTTGDAAIVLMSPWIAEEYATGSALLVDLSELLGEMPEGAIVTTRENGSTACYGVKLSETALWRDNSAVRNTLPEDTVVSLVRPGLVGNNAQDARYQGAVAFFKNILQ